MSYVVFFIWPKVGKKSDLQNKCEERNHLFFEICLMR